MSKLKELVSIKKGTKIEPVNVGEELIRFIQIDDLRNDNNIKLCDSLNKYTQVSEKDVVIAWDGANAGTIGYGLSGAIGSTLARLKIIKENICTQYLGILLQGKFYYLRDTCTGATIPHISRSALENIEVPLLPIEEQKKIAEILDKASNLTSLRKNQIEKLDLLVKSRFVEMFGDPYTNEKRWDIKKLGDLSIKITDGVHAKPNYTTIGKPFISVVNITKGYVNFTNCKYVSEQDYYKMIKSTHPEKGDVLYTKVGATYGIPAFIDTDEDFCLYVSVCLIKPIHKKIDSRFLSISMGMPYVKMQADRRIKGIGVPDLHLNQIREFDIICPPIEMQRKFVSFVHQVDKQKFDLQSSLEKMDLNYKALMQKYFG